MTSKPSPDSAKKPKHNLNRGLPRFFQMSIEYLTKITSRDNPRYKEALKLTTPHGARKQSAIVLSGLKELKLALAKHWPIQSIFLADTKAAEEIYETCLSEQDLTSEIFCLDYKLFKKLVDGREQDAVVAIAEFTERELFANAKIGTSRLIVLDGVQDPGNLGNIIRTAAAFGFTDIISLPGTARLCNPKVWRAAAGSVAAINFYRTNCEQFLKFIENSSFKLLLADIAGQDLNCNLLTKIKSAPFALVLGSEGQGASDELKEQADISIKIPYSDKAESLNVAVAAGILIYELSEFS